MSNSPEYEENIAVLLAEYEKSGNKSEEAFAKLADIFFPYMMKIIQSYQIGENEIDDAKQEALIGLHRAIEVYDPSLSSFSTFAYICMKSSVLSFLRKNKGKLEIPFDTDALSDIPAPETDPESKIIGDEEKNGILKKIEKELSDFEMKVLLMSIAGERSEDISKKLCKPKKSVDNALFRSREKIRRII